MQLAILLILILITVLIAPWLLGVIAIAASLYGVYLVAAAVITAIAFIVAIIWFFFTGSFGDKRESKPEIIIGKRKSCKFCQAEMAVSTTKCRNCGQTEA